MRPETVWQIVARLCLLGVDNPPIKIERELGPYGDWAKEEASSSRARARPNELTRLTAML